VVRFRYKIVGSEYLKGQVMGGFSSSVLIRSSDADAVADKLTQFVEKEGFDTNEKAIENHEGPAIAIFSCDGDWIVVLESEECSWDADEWLSKELKTPVVSVSVHDGDVWSYYWHFNGKLIDQHSSVDLHEYFGVDTSLFDDDDYDFSDEEKDNGLSNLTLNQRWKALKPGLLESTERETFDAVLSPDPDIGGEEGLADFLKLVGLPEEVAYLSYRYWIEDQTTEALTLEQVIQFTEK